MWTTYTIDKTPCYILQQGTPTITYIWPFYPHRGNELEHMEEVLAEEGPNDPAQGYTIVAFQVEDWNRDLSPWPAPTMDGSTFPGGGPELLAWIRSSLYPWMREQDLIHGKCVLMGYSLAGLFAVWSLYESDLFDGAISASGSFWIESWSEYIHTHTIQKPATIYLSLGGKEEKTKNPRMATVGDRTRELEKLIKASPMVENSTLEMNSGGHFADSAKRLVKGIRWIQYV